MRAIKIGLKIIVMAAVFTALVMFLWNWLIPDIFKGPQITYIQALGMLLLSKLLLFPMGRGFGRGSHWKSRQLYWKQFEEKMKSMSPEEREKFKAGFEHKCWGKKDPS